MIKGIHNIDHNRNYRVPTRPSIVGQRRGTNIRCPYLAMFLDRSSFAGSISSSFSVLTGFTVSPPSAIIQKIGACEENKILKSTVLFTISTFRNYKLYSLAPLK